METTNYTRLTTMKREIKFRAWSPDNEEMYYPDNNYEFVIDNASVGLYPRQDHDDLQWYNTNGSDCEKKIEVMQFTGLTDKNGKDIYEGDVVETTSSKGVIEFDKGLFGINWDYGTDRKTMLGAWGTETNLRVMHDGYNDRLTVIGNIYENPELIN